MSARITKDGDLRLSVEKIRHDSSSEYTALDKDTATPASTFSNLAERACGTRSPSSVKMNDGRYKDGDPRFSGGKFAYDSSNEYTALDKDTTNPASTYSSLAETAARIKSPAQSQPAEFNSSQNSKNGANSYGLYSGYDEITDNSVPQHEETELTAGSREISSKREQINPHQFFNAENNKKIKKGYLQRMMNSKIILLCLIITLLVMITLFISACAGVIAAVVKISKLSSEVEQLQSTAQQNMIDQNITEEPEFIFSSCADILLFFPFSQSGNYSILSSNGSFITAYCDMTRLCGGIKGGWIKVYDLDMTDNASQCPNSLEEYNASLRTCITKNSTTATCSSDKLKVNGFRYSKVCGRIRAYQLGDPEAFGTSNNVDPQTNSGRVTNNPNIDTYYVDGVSLTHGDSPRQHIWTFANARNEEVLNRDFICPCFITELRIRDLLIPSFVQDEYFCDTGTTTNSEIYLHEDNPLWDGEGCGPQSRCCSFNDPPWFYRELPWSTTDNIEMRVCRDERRDDEDIAIEAVEIYIQ